MTAAFLPREFLRSRNAILVHFSTVMTSHPDLMFPQDMRRALTLQVAPWAFSTIQPGDSNPHLFGGRGGAEGSIGIVVDIGPGTVITLYRQRTAGAAARGPWAASDERQLRREH
jgi:hypothetical protein